MLESQQATINLTKINSTHHNDSHYGGGSSSFDRHVNNSQITHTGNDQTINTLKEISDLKTEIMKLTSSLRSLKSSPENIKSLKVKPKADFKNQS